MTEWQPRKQVADWWGRGLAFLALVVAGCSLGWQIHEYHDSLQEHILTRVTLQRTMENDKPKTIGPLQIEVVNSGQHPIFIKRVLIAMMEGNNQFKIQAFPENKPRLVDETLRLEPGMNSYYGIDDWSDPLRAIDDPHGKAFSVLIETTRGIDVEQDKVATVAWSITISTKDVRVEEK